MKKTKIIATHWPAIKWEDDLLALYDAGVNVIRFNFSHAQYDKVREVLEIMRKNNRNGRAALSMMLDTKWPEIRTWDLENNQDYKTWDKFKFYTKKEDFTEDGSSLFCDYAHLWEDAFIDQIIDIDSWLFRVKVLEIHDNHLQVEAQNDANIGSRRHVNLPWIRLKMPGITQKDKEDVKFAVEESMDFIALSFVRSKENIEELKAYLKTLWGEHIKIISKIENQEGIINQKEIIAASDGIMVARGDLGIEVPIEKLPTYQANMITDTLEAWKFTIVATHMLESMIENPFPTRAEVSDIYNAVMQKSDCVMLSWETAAWKYPIESVRVMAATIKEAEANISPVHRDFSEEGLTARDIEKKALIKSAIYAAEELKAKWLFIFTKSWKLARLTSNFRPNLSVYAFTMDLNSVAYMNTLYGINPYLINDWNDSFSKNRDIAINISKKQWILKNGDKIIVVNDITKDWEEVPVVELINIS